MRDNWIRNSSGCWINLDKVEYIQINPECYGNDNDFYKISAFQENGYEFDCFEEKSFDTEKEAQDHLDKIMQQKIWD